MILKKQINNHEYINELVTELLDVFSQISEFKCLTQKVLNEYLFLRN
nr:hypothetical protein [Mycoplasmopsis bovis]